MAYANNDLVTVMKKMNLTSDDATSRRQAWRLTSGNWRTTGKLIDTEKCIL
jgi:hypothetical protein